MLERTIRNEYAEISERKKRGKEEERKLVFDDKTEDFKVK